MENIKWGDDKNLAKENIKVAVLMLTHYCKLLVLRPTLLSTDIRK